MTDKIEKMTDDDFKKIMQSLGMPESMSLYAALKQVENHTWQAARTVPDVRCKCCGYLVTESEHRGCLRAAEVTVPDGFVMVPVELLQLIQCDVESAADWLSSANSAFRSLLSATPEGKK